MDPLLKNTAILISALTLLVAFTRYMLVFALQDLGQRTELNKNGLGKSSAIIIIVGSGLICLVFKIAFSPEQIYEYLVGICLPLAFLIITHSALRFIKNNILESNIRYRPRKKCGKLSFCCLVFWILIAAISLIKIGALVFNYFDKSISDIKPIAIWLYLYTMSVWIIGKLQTVILLTRLKKYRIVVGNNIPNVANREKGLEAYVITDFDENVVVKDMDGRVFHIKSSNIDYYELIPLEEDQVFFKVLRNSLFFSWIMGFRRKRSEGIHCNQGPGHGVGDQL